MFDIYKDMWSFEPEFVLKIIYTSFNIVLTFEIEPKQENVKNVNRLKILSILYRILSVTGCCTKYPQLFLLAFTASENN